MLDDGRLTDGHGRTVDFKNSIIIMTSNTGVELIKRESALGFATPKDSASGHKAAYEKMRDKVLSEVKKTFRPEFINRIDDIIVFRELSEGELDKIVLLLLEDLQKRLADRKLKIVTSEEARAWLLKVGYDPAFGARPLRRAMERYLENPLASLLLEGKFAEGDTVMVVRDGNGLAFAPAVHKTSRRGSRTAKPAPKR